MKTQGALDQHFVLLEKMKAARGTDRLHCAESSLAISRAAAAQWRADYPGEPLPEHPAFKRCALEYEKAGRFDDAIAVCERALREGWRGDDWQKRIARCENKKEKPRA